MRSVLHVAVRSDYVFVDRVVRVRAVCGTHETKRFSFCTAKPSTYLRTFHGAYLQAQRRPHSDAFECPVLPAFRGTYLYSDPNTYLQPFPVADTNPDLDAYAQSFSSTDGIADSVSVCCSHSTSFSVPFQCTFLRSH
jgi:hypothetical protein